MIDKNLVDEVLMSLGELRSERRHRAESDNKVVVDLFDRYALMWHPGNTLDICHMCIPIATLRLNSFDIYKRDTAVAIAGIITAHMLKGG